MAQIQWFDCSAAGRAVNVTTGPTETGLQLFRRQMGRRTRPDDYIIRVNNEPVRPGYVLRTGDRVVVTSARVRSSPGRLPITWQETYGVASILAGIPKPDLPTGDLGPVPHSWEDVKQVGRCLAAGKPPPRFDAEGAKMRYWSSLRLDRSFP